MTLRVLALALTIPIAACASKPETTPESQTPAASSSTVATVDTSLVRVDRARMKGSEAAKVWFLMSSDFQCPFCRQFHQEVWPAIEKEYVATGKVRVAFVNHPMSFHALAIPAAEAAMCAGKQDRFWPMHDALFITQDRWAKGSRPQQVFDSLATSLGLRMEDWRSCISTGATRAMVDADFARSKGAGVTGTPSFFIGGRLAIVGADSLRAFRQAIDAAIAQAGRE